MLVGRTLFATAGGLFRSTDDGGSWTYVGHSPEGMVVSALAEPGEQPGALIGLTRTGRLVHSMDSGASWTALGGPPAFVDRLALVPTAPTTLLASAIDILWGSTDLGAHWTQLVRAPSTIRAITIGPGKPAAVFLSLDRGLLRSDNGGHTWTVLAARLKGGGRLVDVDYLVGSDQTGTLYAEAVLDFGAGLVKSEDGGWSWAVVSERVFGPVLADPLNPSVLYTGGIYSDGQNGFWISRNGGNSWTKRPTTPPDFFGSDEIRTAFFSPHAHALYVGTRSHGIAESRDGGKSWTAGAQAGLFSGVWTALQFRPGAPQEVFLALDGLHDSLYSSTDSGLTWAPLGQPDPYWGISALGLDPADPKLIYAGSPVRGVWRSVDGGVTWEHSLDLLSRPLSFAFPEPGAVLVGMDYGVYRSADRGKTWTMVLAGNPDGSPFFFESHLVPDPAQPRTVYAWTDDGDSSLLQIWKSEDAGLTWRELPEHAGTLAIDPRQPATLYAVEAGSGQRGGAVVRTTDSGET
ncbi:MAG TPA: hypothetical protein VH988_02405 [Thermoanaerobaculia bacterium]|jgi:photosystem II stability/assembly factor-like uncharacterized protein|nr:hypothetical protein [Thermoanaerobaculia bacterium]